MRADRLTPHEHVWKALRNPPRTADFAAEGAVRLIREVDATVRRLVRASLFDGHEHTAQVAKTSLSVLVRADSGHETYVALRILGPVPKNLLIVILDLVPGCDRNAWFPELTMPHRALNPGEQVWSTLMDPVVASQLIGGSG